MPPSFVLHEKPTRAVQESSRADEPAAVKKGSHVVVKYPDFERTGIITGLDKRWAYVCRDDDRRVLKYHRDNVFLATANASNAESSSDADDCTPSDRV